MGAGPAGAAAAIALARAGRDVTVVDKATFPRDKICGDGLTTGALRLLEGLGLQPEAVASWQRVDDVVVRSPSGREATFPMPRGPRHLRRRHPAHRPRRRPGRPGPVRRAPRSSTATPAPAPPRHDDHVTVDVEGHGTLTARWLVAADGMWSPVRKALGLATPGYRGEWHAFRQYFTGVGPRAQRELFVWFEPDLLPGYAWSFPLPGGVANVGFGIQRGGKVARIQEMGALWPDILARPHIREVLGDGAEPESPHRAWPIPGPGRRGGADRQARPVRRRRRRRHRRAHRRGHRPGAAHRGAGRRGHRAPAIGRRAR